VTEAQTWTVIGGLLAALVVMAGLVLRIVQVEIRSLDVKFTARLDALDRAVQQLS